jgi:hypothetical protein
MDGGDDNHSRQQRTAEQWTHGGSHLSGGLSDADSYSLDLELVFVIRLA